MQRTGATTVHLAPTRPPSGSEGRLAELVAHLTGCSPHAALDAVEGALPDDHPELSLDDRLGIVAQAIVTVKREQRLDLRERRQRRERRPA